MRVVICCLLLFFYLVVFFFQAEDGIRDRNVTGVQTCAFRSLNEFYTTTTVNFDNHLTSDLVAIDQQTLSKKEAKKVIHVLDIVRSEERRVGKECKSRWARDR